LRGVSQLNPARPEPFAAAARLLAEEAIRIDPASAALRQVATGLQRAAGAADLNVRARAVSDAGAAAASEARAAHADATLDDRVPSAPLVGAFADALGVARLKASRYDRGQR